MSAEPATGRPGPAPERARAGVAWRASLGLLLPGLGHLLHRRFLDAAGLLLWSALFWAATLGVGGLFHRLPTLGFYGHALRALVPWATFAVPLYGAAWRFAAAPGGRPALSARGRAGVYLLGLVVFAVLNRGTLAGPPGVPVVAEGALPEPPSWASPLGTGPEGGDLFSQVLAAGLPTLSVVVIATGQAALLALPLRALPPLRALAQTLPPLVWILLAFGLADPLLALAWCAAPALSRVILEPRALPAALARAAAQILLLRAAYQFLWRDPRAPSWGRLADEGRTWVDHAPWVLLGPSLALLLLGLGLTLLGDGLRTARWATPEARE